MDENVRLKIDILLHEYVTLREEVLRRYDAQFQSIGAISVVLVGLLTALVARYHPAGIFALIVISFSAFVAIFAWADSDITTAVARLRELESDINQRAGETLLIWETKSGGTILTRIRKKRLSIQSRGPNTKH